MSDFALTPSDRNSSLWRRLKAHLEDRQATLRRQNDNLSLGESQTAAIRGRLALLEELLALEAASEVEP